MAAVIDLTHTGTPAQAWRAVVSEMPTWSLPLRRYQRLVVAAPHPDDETLGAGGLICEAARLHWPVVVLSISDGEAAYPAKTPTSAVDLAAQRRAEVHAAIKRLGSGAAIEIVRGGFPDGYLESHLDSIVEFLEAHTRRGDLLIAPLVCDGHPDHDAVGRAASTVAERGGLHVLHYPIWAWHWHSPADSLISRSGQRFELSPPAIEAKQGALLSFTSQSSGSDPVLPSHFLDRFDSPFEVFVPG